MALLVNPTPRWSASMAELTGSSKIVLFGGRTTANTSTPNFCSDSFFWDGTKWNTITGTLPSYRAEAPCSFDGTNVSLTCGTNDTVNLSDHWFYNGTSWAQKVFPALTIPYTRPTTLRAAGMAYQSAGPEVVLFGGSTPYNREYTIDTWHYVAGTPGTWTLKSPATTPPAKEYIAFASNSITAVMFGGKDFNGGTSGTYTYNGTTWTNITSGTAGVDRPSARYGAKMVYDTSTSLFILFGGITSNGYNNETWSFNTTGNIWTNITPAVSPPSMAFHSMAYMSSASNTLLFGGLNSRKCYNETWLFNSTTNVWSKQ